MRDQPNFLHSKFPSPLILSSPDWEDYSLLDSGKGRKLEQYGTYSFIKPDHQAIWQPALPKDIWENADAEFLPSGGESGGNWIYNHPIPHSWEMQYKNLRFELRTSASRHLGVFPEQADHWDWITVQIQRRSRIHQNKAEFRVLNLFGYTGLASLAASSAGAHVTHVDASKKAVRWAQKNQTLSGLNQRPIRWIVDDALKYVMRENRRGSRYDAIILDPPKFGRGPKGQVWEFFESIQSLLSECRNVLVQKPSFILLTAYAIRASAISLHYAVHDMMSGLGGSIESGELVVVEKSAGRVLPTAIFSRWSASKTKENS